MVVFDSGIRALNLDLIEHGFEFADDEHVVIHLFQTIDTVLLRFLLIVRLVLVDRNRPEGDLARLADFFRINILNLRHGSLLLNIEY